MMTPGYIYVIKAETGHCKIGRSRNVPNRMKLFAVKLPFNFEIINYFPTDDMVTAEKELHQIFNEQRVNGEWFLLSDRNIEFLKAIGCIKRLEYSDVPDFVSEMYPITCTPGQHYYDKNAQLITLDYPDPPWWFDEEFKHLLVP